MSGAFTPGTVQTAPYGWNNQTSVQPASPYTPQPECKLIHFFFKFVDVILSSYLI